MVCQLLFSIRTTKTVWTGGRVAAEEVKGRSRSAIRNPKFAIRKQWEARSSKFEARSPKSRVRRLKSEGQFRNPTAVFMALFSVVVPPQWLWVRAPGRGR